MSRYRPASAPHLARAAAFALAALLVLGGPTPAAAGGVERLQRFFDKVRTYAATFEQVILDEGLNRIEESGGRMWIARPGRFRWDYRPPLEQHIIGDGERVWVYDVELEQVTVRRLGEALGRTPAILLAGEGDIESTYDVTDLGAQGELAWVALRPKDDEAQFSDIRLGFEGDALRVLELIDGLGQTTRIVFSRTRENPDVDLDLFRFVPPRGVDVIDETQ